MVKTKLKDNNQLNKLYAKHLAKVKQDGYNIKDIPDELITKEMCLAAVKRSGCTLRYVPDEFKMMSFCIDAVKQNDYVLKDVLNELYNGVISLIDV